MNYILYNPLSGNGEGGERIRVLRESLAPSESVFEDIRVLSDASRLSWLTASDRLILAGGDGTLHRFLSEHRSHLPVAPLFLFPTGNANRFYHRLANGKRGLLPIGGAIRGLPTVHVFGKPRVLLNGIGAGLDGFLREEERRRSRHSEQPLPSTAAQIKGLLLGTRPFSAEVTVDGTLHRLSLVRSLAVTVGSCTEGGLRLPKALAPRGEGASLAAVSLNGITRYRLLMQLPHLIRDGFPQAKDSVWSSLGDRVSVRFSSPQSLSLDGELLFGVTSLAIESQYDPEEQQ